MGYCFGGAVVLGMARVGKKLAVAASFHGLLQTETPMPKNGFSGKLLVFNGADDPMVTADILAAFEAEMTSAGIDFNVVNYPGVVHGFTNPAATARGEATGMPLRYDRGADEDSWQHTIQAIKATQSPNAK
jgi:dienelactone hydrolase